MSRSSSSSASIALTDPQIRWHLKEMLTHLPQFSWRCLKVIPKGGGLVPMQLTSVQLRIHREAEDQVRRTGMVRKIILKPRRAKVTTYIAARAFHRAMTTVGTFSRILTHELKASEFVFKMFQNFYDNLPIVSDFSLKPETVYSTKREISFAAPLTSSLLVDTVGESTARSGATHFLHGSEAAYWKMAKKAWNSMAKTLPPLAGTEGWIESTANGRSGWFYEQWKRAVEGKSKYEPIFIAWYEDTDNVMQPPENFRMTRAEEVLSVKYKLTPEQVYWRRYAIEEECSGDEDTFKQDYPSTPEEAFLLSGSSYLPINVLQKVESCERKPLACGQMSLTVEHDGSSRSSFLPYSHQWSDRTAPLSIWRFPEAKRPYVIFVDIGGTQSTSDYTAAVVLDHYTGEYVAEWYGHGDPDEVAAQMDLLGRWYNDALLCIERNPGRMNFGPAVIKSLILAEYPNLYKQMLADREKDDETEVVGWWTGSTNRNQIIGAILRVCRDAQKGDGTIRSKNLIGELGTLIKSQRSRIEAAEGEHDDLCMAFGGAHVLRQVIEPTSMDDEESRTFVRF